MRNRRGFTLVELLLVLALAGIVMALVMSFLINNIKSFNRINTDSELQYQVQNTLNIVVNRIVESKSISYVRDNNGNDVTDIAAGGESDAERQVSEIKFSFYDKEENIDKVYIFSISDSLSFDGTEICNNVEGLWIKPVPWDKPFDEVNLLELRLKLKKDNRTYEATDRVYMRNFKN